MQGVRGSSPLVSTMKKAKSYGLGFFQRNKSTLCICEMRFAREIRLRRVKCLRTWVDLFHFTLRHRRKISRLPKGKHFTSSRRRDISPDIRWLESIRQKRTLSLCLIKRKRLFSALNVCYAAYNKSPALCVSGTGRGDFLCFLRSFDAQGCDS